MVCRFGRFNFWLRWVIGIYGIVTVCYALAWLLLPRFNPHTAGCFFTEGMVTYIICQGFPGASILAWLLNFPYSFWYWPMFALYHLSEGEKGKGLSLLVGTLLIYMPLIVGVICYFSTLDEYHRRR